jgi:opacity protein-like surface antigen
VAYKLSYSWDKLIDDDDQTTYDRGGAVRNKIALGLEIPVEKILGDVRFEFEYGNGTNNKYSIIDKQYPLLPPFEPSVKLQTYFINGYYNFDGIGCGIKPYIGAGVGIAQSDVEMYWQYSTVSATVDALSYSTAYNASIGLLYEVVKNMSLDFGYRYTNLGGINVSEKVYSGGNFIGIDNLQADLSSSELYIGLKYNF